MIAYNFCKETTHSKKYKKFKADIVMVDIFHNINFIKFKNGIKFKKDIIKYFDSGKLVSINLINSYLKEYGLYCGLTYNVRNVYYYDIVCITNEQPKYKFSDLD